MNLKDPQLKPLPTPASTTNINTRGAHTGKGIIVSIRAGTKGGRSGFKTESEL